MKKNLKITSSIIAAAMIFTAMPCYYNNYADAVLIDALQFSAGSGFYDTNFELTISSPRGNDIYYTIDGTNPITSDTAMIYDSAVTVEDRTSQPNVYSAYAENDTATSICMGLGYKAPNFSVDKPTVVRAVSKDANGEYSSVVSHTYFITTGNLEQYKDLTVVSLVTDPENLFDPDKGIYVTGQQYIDWKNSPDYDPDKSVWDKDYITNYYSRGREWEREADIAIFENGKNIVKQSVGIRIKGASTRNNSQKSFNIYARGDYGASKIEYPLLENNYSINGKLIKKYDSICLRSTPDEVRLRDGFAQKLIHDRESLTTQDMKQCAVFLNGEYWGQYEMTEKFSDYFIQSNYNIPKENVAMVKNGELEEGPESEKDNLYGFMYNYARKDLTIESNYNAVCDFIDIDSLIEHYAAGLYLGTYDWPNYNYGMWKNMGSEIAGNPYSDGKWRFITFDLDYTMGASYENLGTSGYAYDSFKHMDEKSGEYSPTDLFISLLKNETFRNKFAAVYCDYANEVLAVEKADEMIEYYKENYTDNLAKSQLRWWGFYGGTVEGNMAYYKNNYASVLSGIRTFFNQRAYYTLEDMKDFTGITGELQSITLGVNGNGKIKINTITPDMTNGEWSGKYYSDCPITITAMPNDGKEFLGWTGDLESNEKTLTLTLEEAMNLKANFTPDTLAVLGDVNSDGVLDILDVKLLQRWLVGSGEIEDISKGDVNSDGKVNIFDLSLIKSEIMS